MSNIVVSQTTVSPTPSFAIKTRKKKHHHHKQHKHHHRKHRHDTSEPLVKEQATTSYTATATTLPDVSQITVSISRTTTIEASPIATPDSKSTFSKESSYKISATESHQIASTTDSDNYFIEETPTSALSMTTITPSNTIALSLYRPTSRLLTPPRDHPMRDKRPLSSSLMISASVLPSPSIIQPIPAKAITSSSTRVPAPTITGSNGNNGNATYHHKAQIHSSNRDLGLGLGLGFGGFSILALTALVIQNHKKRQRNQNALGTGNHIDNNGVFFTEKPSMFKRKSATTRQSKQNSFISTKWRPQSFLGVVANVIAAKLSKRGSSNSFAQFGESGTVDYDPLTYPQPLYSPVKATYQDMWNK